MKQASREKYMVVVLFALVLTVFTMAQRDSRRLDRLYLPARGPQSHTKPQQPHGNEAQIHEGRSYLTRH